MTDQKSAKASYRAAWIEWRDCLDDDRRQELENVMDGLQPAIAPRADHPDWQEFADSLPGFRECWAGIHDKATRIIIEKLGPELPSHLR